MSDLITCPDCGLSQSAKHAFCARCDRSFATSGTVSAVGSGEERGLAEDLVTEETARPGAAERRTPRGGASRGGAESTPTDKRRPESGPAAPPRDRERDQGTSTDSMDSVSGADAVSTTLESEAGAVGPAWNMPGREPDARTDSFPTPRLPNAGGRRSLSARGRAPTKDPLPSVAPTPDTPPSPPRPPPEPPPIPQSSSRPGSDVRGRPPGSLFASENSLPPGDPLMAALVSGDALRADSFPDIDFSPSRPGRPAPEESAPTAAPPRSEPSAPPGPRVVPPSRGRRNRSGVGQRSRPGGLLPDGLRGSFGGAADLTGRSHGAAIPPEPSAPGGTHSEPSSPGRIPGERSSPGRIPGERSSPGRIPWEASNPGGIPGEPSAPGRIPRELSSPSGVSDLRAGGLPPPPRSTFPGAHSTRDPRQSSLIDGRAPDDLPIPPPMDLPDDLGGGVDRARLHRGVKVAAVFATLAVLALAALNVSSMVADIGALQATIDANIRSDGSPTPDLPQVLDRAVQEMDLGDHLVRRWATLSAANDRFDVGVTIEHSIVGFPQETSISRSGPFVVQSHLKTLDLYLDEWDLDDAGEQLLERDRQRRRNR